MIAMEVLVLRLHCGHEELVEPTHCEVVVTGWEELIMAYGRLVVFIFAGIVCGILSRFG